MVNVHFFKTWTPEMAYVLGYIVADGCLIATRNNTSYILNITSIDLDHLKKIRKVLSSDCSISQKKNSSGGFGYQIQIRNLILANDLLKIGIKPRKTYNLKNIVVPDNLFPHFARGFFDGDGTVYIYQVNGTPQIKAGFVSASKIFFTHFNRNLSKALLIPTKMIHKKIDKRGVRVVTYYTYYYVVDCEKMDKFFYNDSDVLCLKRKREVFSKWKNIIRRKYIHQV